MPSPCLLALDQGTTSSRAIVFDARADLLSTAQQELVQKYPRPGWVEHDPEEIWETSRRVLLAAVAEANLDRSSLAGVGITNQRETTVLWERSSGRPLAPAIVWQDRRTTALCRRLAKQGLEPLFRERTGLVLDPYFSGTKIAWLLDNVPGARKRAQRGELAFGTVDSWLLWRLTGGKVHATDVSNASRTLLCSLATGAWDDELLKVLRIPRELLPEILPSSGFLGEIETVPALKGLPILGMAGDQQAALFGQACFRKGQAKNTYGTGCFLLMHTGRKPMLSKNKLLTTIAWRLGPKEPLEYALEGSVFVGGAVVQWLRDGLGLIGSSSEVEPLAASVEDNGGVVFVPAFTGLGAPHWDPSARGALFGLTRGTTSGHIARAALESIAYQCGDLLAAMQKDASLRLRELRVDGGATANDRLLQFQSDLLRTEVIRPKVRETTALGAAFLAGLAAGVWKSREEIDALWKVDRRFVPETSAKSASRGRKLWDEAVRRSKNWSV